MKLKLFLILLFILPSVLAINLSTTITAEQKQDFDQILEPVMKLYNFAKYVSTLVAGMFLLFGGITFMSSGNDPYKRQQAKSILTYVVVGLVVIWAAPFLVSMLA